MECIAVIGTKQAAIFTIYIIIIYTVCIILYVNHRLGPCGMYVVYISSTCADIESICRGEPIPSASNSKMMYTILLLSFIFHTCTAAFKCPSTGKAYILD